MRQRNREKGGRGEDEEDTGTSRKVSEGRGVEGKRIANSD